MTNTHSFGALVFESDDQSIFEAGSALDLSDSTFIGIDEENLGSLPIGGVTGGFLSTGALGVASLDKLKLGFEAGYLVDSGSIDSQVTYLADLELPTNFVFDAGSPINLTPNSTLSGGSFSTQSPTAEAYVDIVVEADATFSVLAEVLGATVLDESDSVSFDQQFNLISIDPGQLELFSDIDGLGATADIFNDALGFKYVPGSRFWAGRDR